jgi:hypothetical protein
MAYLSEQLRDEVRQLVLQTLQAADVVRRDELEALRAIVAASSRPLTAQDRHTLGLVLPALASMIPGVWVTAAEVWALAVKQPGRAADELFDGCSRFRSNAEPAKALGKFLRRCTAKPVLGLHLERMEGSNASEPPVYRVAGLSAPESRPGHRACR